MRSRPGSSPISARASAVAVVGSLRLSFTTAAAAQASSSRARSRGSSVGGGLVEVVAHERHRPHGMAGGGHRLAGPADERDEVDPVGHGGGRPRQELEDRLEVLGGVVGAADRHRLLTGLDAGRGSRSRCRARPGRGWPARRPCASTTPLVSASTYLRVQPHPLAGQQVAVHRLGEQGVAEGVAVGVARDQHVGLDGGPDAAVELVGRQADDRGEQRDG